MTTEDLQILLTNDDGIDSPGLAALQRALSSIGSVTVVAPAAGQSGIGRAVSVGRDRGHGERGEDGVDVTTGQFSCTIPYRENDLGYAVEGTPCDCVVLGIHALDGTPDVVVTGCNPGPNVGADTLSRSGTTSAAMEAAYAGVPAVASSINTVNYDQRITEETFERNTSVVAELVERTLGAGVFEEIDYVNVNGPRPDRPIESVEVTRPTPNYGMDASFSAGQFRLHFDLLERFEYGEEVDPPGSDLRAVAEGRVSISPLLLRNERPETEGVESIADELV